MEAKKGSRDGKVSGQSEKKDGEGREMKSRLSHA